MKTFNEYQLSQLPKNTRIRDIEPHTNFDNIPSNAKQEAIGYFQWTGVTDDRVLTKLEQHDIEWFKSQNFPITNVFRYYTEKGITSLLMIDAKVGKVKFFDNETYKETDKITFAKRWLKYKLLVIDTTEEAKTAFGV